MPSVVKMAISEAMTEVEGWAPWRGEPQGEKIDSPSDSGSETEERGVPAPDPFELWLRKRRWRAIQRSGGWD